MKRLLLLSLLICVGASAQLVPIGGITSSAVPSNLTVVQSRQSYSTATGITSKSIGLTSTTGNLLVAFVREGSNATDNFTVTDNLNQTWTQAGSYESINSSNRSGIFYRANSSAVTTVTANFTTSGGVTRAGIVCYEISGAASSSPLDVIVQNVNTASTTSLTSSMLTTTNANDILLFGADVTTDQTYPGGFTAGSGFDFFSTSFSMDTRQAVSYEIVSTLQSNVTTSMSWGATGSSSGGFVAFKSSSNIPSPLSITTASLPNGIVNNSYSSTLAATGGTPSYTWALSAGSLPGGLNLTGSTGVISGTPTATGTSNFTTKVTDSVSNVATKALAITITTAPSGWYSSTSPVNTPIPSCANAATCIATNSQSWVTGSLVNTGGSGEHLSIGGYGVGVLIATSSNSTVQAINCTNYNSNTCNVGGTVTFPIPTAAGSGSIPSGTDHSMVFLYTTNDSSGYYGHEISCWNTIYNGSSWSCLPSEIQNFPNGNNDGIANQTVENNGWGTCAPYANEPAANTNGTWASGNYGCTGGTASGISFGAGLLRAYEVANCTSEAACATAIPHSLDFQSQNLANTSNYACPATHTDSNGNHGAGTGAPEGVRFFLPSSYIIANNDSGWSQLEKAVAYALQTYGAYIEDYTGGGSQIQGETDSNASINGESITWSSLGISDGASLSHIPWGQMQIISGAYCNGAGTY